MKTDNSLDPATAFAMLLLGVAFVMVIIVIFGVSEGGIHRTLDWPWE